MSERPKCGCGNTKDENGYCDGSHMNIVKEDKNVKNNNLVVGSLKRLSGWDLK